MPERKPSTPEKMDRQVQVDTIELKLKSMTSGARASFSRLLTREIDVSVLEIKDELMVQLEIFLATLEVERVEAVAEAEVTCPETWWDHLKERWFPPKAIRRWPPQYRRKTSRVSQTVLAELAFKDIDVPKGLSYVKLLTVEKPIAFESSERHLREEDTTGPRTSRTAPESEADAIDAVKITIVLDIHEATDLDEILCAAMGKHPGAPRLLQITRRLTDIPAAPTPPPAPAWTGRAGLLGIVVEQLVDDRSPLAPEMENYALLYGDKTVPGPEDVLHLGVDDAESEGETPADDPRGGGRTTTGDRSKSAEEWDPLKDRARTTSNEEDLDDFWWRFHSLCPRLESGEPGGWPELKEATTAPRRYAYLEEEIADLYEFARGSRDPKDMVIHALILRIAGLRRAAHLRDGSGGEAPVLPLAPEPPVPAKDLVERREFFRDCVALRLRRCSSRLDRALVKVGLVRRSTFIDMLSGSLEEEHAREELLRRGMKPAERWSVPNAWRTGPRATPETSDPCAKSTAAEWAGIDLAALVSLSRELEQRLGRGDGERWVADQLKAALGASNDESEIEIQGGVGSTP